MADFTWSQVRDTAIDRFAGQTPGAQLEEDVRLVFVEHPQRVVGEIDRVAAKFVAGKVSAPWAILRMNLRELDQRPDVTVSDTSEREKRIGWVEQWLRVAGLHFDRESEILDEVFGFHGKLRDWADDEGLRVRVLEQWRLVRPRGVLVEVEMETRGARNVLQRAAMRAPAVERVHVGDELELEVSR